MGKVVIAPHTRVTRPGRAGPTLLPMPSLERFWAVVPAGGAGTRLWPLSRSSSPKFLHDLTGSGRSLLQGTVDRLAPLVDDRIVVVTGALHLDAVRRQLAGLPDEAVVAEPSPRDSMAAVGLAAALLERRDPDAVMGSFAADHVIGDAGAFRATVRVAEQVAPRRLAGHARDRADPPRDRLRLHRARRGAPRPPRRPRRRRVRREALGRRGRAVRLVGPLPLERGHVRGPAAGAARPARHLAPRLRGPAARDRRRPGPPGGGVAARCRGSRSTTRSPSPPPTPAGWPWCRRRSAGTTSATSTRSPSSLAADDGRLVVLGDEGLVRGSDSSGLVVAASGRRVHVIGLDDVVVVDTGDVLLVTTRSARAGRQAGRRAPARRGSRRPGLSARSGPPVRSRTVRSRWARASRCRGTSARSRTRPRR